VKESIQEKKIRRGERGRRDCVGSKGEEKIKEKRRGVEIRAKMGERKAIRKEGEETRRQ
jgi:hypothetical protein